jgi:hypothetical protein
VAKITEQMKLSIAAIPKSTWNMNDPENVTQKYFHYFLLGASAVLNHIVKRLKLLSKKKNKCTYPVTKAEGSMKMTLFHPQATTLEIKVEIACLLN